MTRTQALAHILNSKGRFLFLEFTKRTTGQSRQMLCRLGVTAPLKGGERSYDATSKGLLLVYDMLNHGYRSIPVEGITRVKIKGQWHTIIQED